MSRTIRRFTENDWPAWQGASKFADGNEPVIVEGHPTTDGRLCDIIFGGEDISVDVVIYAKDHSLDKIQYHTAPNSLGTSVVARVLCGEPLDPSWLHEV